MKKLIICMFCLVLYGCDNSMPEAEIMKTAQIERAQVIAEIENKIPIEQQKRNFENRLYDDCQNRFVRETGITYPIAYKNRVCVCFAEKTTAFISSSEQEIEKYNNSEIYQIKIQERFFGECTEQNAKYKRF